MPGNLTEEGEVRALNLLFREEGTRPDNLYIGLSTTIIYSGHTLSDIIEPADDSYSRVEVNFKPPESINEKHQIKNDAKVKFGPWSQDAAQSIKSVFITDTESGTEGDLLFAYTLNPNKTPKASESLNIDTDTCKINLT